MGINPYDENAYEIPVSQPAVGGGHVVQDETTPLTARANLNFVGAGVTVTDDAGTDTTTVTVPGTAGGTGVIATPDDGELHLTPKAASTGARGTVFFSSDDDYLYVATGS
jgi:hypothetical protein